MLAGVDLLLRAVLDDGTRRRAGVPSDTRRALRLTRGATQRIRCYLTTISGVPVDLALSGADRLRLSVRELGGTDPEFAVDATKLDTVGWYAFDLPPARTAELRFDRYAYDVWARVSGSVAQVVALSELRLAPRAASRSIEA